MADSDQRYEDVAPDWLGDVVGKRILCLAGGGGQQGPILAAAGARVVVFDASTGQLAQDRAVADREELEIATVQGDMADLSMFDEEQFDVILNPVSTLFVPELDRCGANAIAHSSRVAF